MSFDTLHDKIKKKKNPVTAVLDAQIESIPPFILEKYIQQHGETLEAAAHAVSEFSCGLIGALSDVVPAITVQSTGFERLGWRGIKVLEELIAYAKDRGLFVIADAGQGCMSTGGSPWLGETQVGGSARPVFDADCVTLNGYMGSDAMKPFLRECAARDKCAFVLVKTPNPSSVEFQDIVAGDRLVYTVMGDLVQRWGQGTGGKYGYQALGAVVGATKPNILRELRYRLDKTFFLIPGYDSADTVRFAFDELGRGAIVSVSHPISSAWQNTGRDGTDYQDAAHTAAERIQGEIKQNVTIL